MLFAVARVTSRRASHSRPWASKRMTSFPSIPGGDYRLINATVPLCLLEAADGGNARSDALASATLTIRAGKIQRLALDTHAGVAPDADAAASNLPALDLDRGMIWPVCADLHTHLDKGQTWFRVPNTSGRWQDALALVARDRGAFWNAADVAARMDFSLRCAFVHGTAAIRTHINSMGPQADISWPVLAPNARPLDRPHCLAGRVARHARQLRGGGGRAACRSRRRSWRHLGSRRD